MAKCKALTVSAAKGLKLFEMQYRIFLKRYKSLSSRQNCGQQGTVASPFKFLVVHALTQADATGGTGTRRGAPGDVCRRPVRKIASVVEVAGLTRLMTWMTTRYRCRQRPVTTLDTTRRRTLEHRRHRRQHGPTITPRALR